jgi:hypothetical protein
MTVPAHAHGDAHGPYPFGGLDAYEEIIASVDNYQLWSYPSGGRGGPSGSIPLYTNLESIFRTTADYSEEYDSGPESSALNNGIDDMGYDGDDESGIPNTGRHRPDLIDRHDGFSINEIAAIGDDLMPYAIEQTAAFIRLFFSAADLTAPAVQLLGLSSDPNNPTIYNYSTIQTLAYAQDSESGVDNDGYHFKTADWNGSSWSEWHESGAKEWNPFFEFSDGLHKIKVSVENGGGRQGESVEYFIKVTTSGDPVTGLTVRTESGGYVIGQNNWQTDNDPYISWNSGSSIVGYSVSLDDPPGNSVTCSDNHYQFGTDSIPNGTHTINVKSLNTAGYWGPATSFSIYVDDAGDTITGLSALTAEGGSSIGQNTWQADDDPYFYWNIPSSSAPINGYSFSFDTPPADSVNRTVNYYQYSDDAIPNGQHTFFVKSRDEAGNWGPTASFSIYVDDVGDTITGLSAFTTSGGSSIGQGTWQTDDDPYFSWNVPNSSSPIVGYSFSLDSPPADAVNRLENHYSYPNDALLTGQHTFFVKSLDTAGNWGPAASFNIYVDDTGDAISSITGAGTDPHNGWSPISSGDWQTDDDPFFSWSVLLNGSPIIGYSISLDSEPANTINCTEGFFQFLDDAIPNGAHTFHVKAKDSMGFWGPESIFLINVDDSPLKIVSVTPALNGEEILPPFISIDVTFSEPIDTASFDQGDIWLSKSVASSFGNFDKVILVGERLYAVTSEGFRIYSIAIPSIPLLLGFYPLSNITDMKIVGNTAYVANGTGGLHIINVSNPAGPVRLGGYIASKIDPLFQTPYTGSIYDVEVKDNIVYVMNQGGSVGAVYRDILDVTNPASPILHASSSYGGYGAYAYMAIVDDFAYLIKGWQENPGYLSIEDISDPLMPIELGSHSLQVSSIHCDPYVSGDRAYCAMSDGLQIWDVSNPASMARIGIVDSLPNIQDIQVVGNTSYVATTDGLELFDLSNATMPVKLGATSFETETNVEIGNGLCYAALGDNGLEIFQIESVPADITSVAGNTYRITFAQPLDGIYQLQIGPDVRDTTEAPMNQDGDRLAGEKEDAYMLRFSVNRPPQTYVVNSLEDTISLDGVITLREAIEAANANRPIGDAPAGSYMTDVITFAPELFTDGTNPLPRTITLGGNQLEIRDRVIIEGPGKELLTIDANHQSRVFHITDVKASISGVTIAGGFVADTGGGILNYGNLTLTNTAVTNNSTSDSRYYDGGGISNIGTLRIVGSIISHNYANGNESCGGGICNYSNMSIEGSTISGNQATDGLGGGVCNYFGTMTISNSNLFDNIASQGGGITNYETNEYGSSILTVKNSSIYGNSAWAGGGICNVGDLTVANTRINGNSAWGTNYQGGGGIENVRYAQGGSLLLVNSTIASNSSSYSGGGVWSAIWDLDLGQYIPVELESHNSLISLNSAPANADSFGSLSPDSSYNLIGFDPHFVRNPSDGGDGWGDNPSTPGIDEGANDDYGNLHLTVGSPCIDAGDPSGSYAGQFDLDGEKRLMGSRVDIGADEWRNYHLEITWDGGGADNRWTTAENWTGDMAPLPGDLLVFPSSASKQESANDYLSGTHFGSITVSGNGYIFHNGILSTTSVQILSGTLTVDSIVADALIIGVPHIPVTRTWDGGGADSKWSTTANWVGDVKPSAGDNLVFPTGVDRLDNVNDYPAVTVFGSIVVSGNNYHIQNDTIRSMTVEVLGNSELTAVSIVCDTLIIGSTPGNAVSAVALNATVSALPINENEKQSIAGNRPLQQIVDDIAAAAAAIDRPSAIEKPIADVARASTESVVSAVVPLSLYPRITSELVSEISPHSLPLSQRERGVPLGQPLAAEIAQDTLFQPLIEKPFSGAEYSDPYLLASIDIRSAFPGTGLSTIADGLKASIFGDLTDSPSKTRKQLTAAPTRNLDARFLAMQSLVSEDSENVAIDRDVKELLLGKHFHNRGKLADKIIDEIHTDLAETIF